MRIVLVSPLDGVRENDLLVIEKTVCLQQAELDEELEIVWLRSKGSLSHKLKADIAILITNGSFNVDGFYLIMSFVEVKPERIIAVQFNESPAEAVLVHTHKVVPWYKPECRGKLQQYLDLLTVD